MQQKERLQFFINNAPVGIFRLRGYPTSSGRYKYQPYRGRGHFWLASSLRAGESVECWFVRKGRKMVFKVLREDKPSNCPECEWFVAISKPIAAVKNPQP